MQNIKYRCSRCHNPLYPKNSAWIDEGYNVYCDECGNYLLNTECKDCFYYFEDESCMIAEEGNCHKPNKIQLSRIWINDYN